MDIPKSKKRPWGMLPPDRPMQGRSRIAFYHTARWTRESRAYREANPLCRKCKEQGIVTPSKVVDHIIPLEICEDPWDRNNWQPLCGSHNNSKAAEDKILIAKNRKK